MVSMQPQSGVPPSTYRSLILVFLLGFLISPTYTKGTSLPQGQQPKSRQKRILWITEDGRLALPPGTTMTVGPSLSMPFVRYPPNGFWSNLTVSLPFTIMFDSLGLTDNENPYGVLPPLLARSMGRAAGGALANYIGKLLDRRRGKRSVVSDEDIRPPKSEGHVHGGERALIYLALEDFLENFGLEGKACLLRAICEVHAHSMQGFGLIGEMLKLFLSASKSPYAHLMEEYVEAERAGKGVDGGPAECWPYMKDCPKSLFTSKHSKYSETFEDNEIGAEEEVEESKVIYNPAMHNM
ncbi:uncharacterized protein LOC126736118 [Anthonomus grandis grandis]|uniref:uncharacterized protein LOC126736118 n=1 Tax=Anthonomus grandis grandis TaxID=2921223 RepID=UPI0021658140|nr:uncharacterized protein LOC126736118 [Anthonomus grandis grandis]